MAPRTPAAAGRWANGSDCRCRSHGFSPWAQFNTTVIAGAALAGGNIYEKPLAIGSGLERVRAADAEQLARRIHAARLGFIRPDRIETVDAVRKEGGKAVPGV